MWGKGTISLWAFLAQRAKGFSSTVLLEVCVHAGGRASIHKYAEKKKQGSLAIFASSQTTHPCLLGAGM